AGDAGPDSAALHGRAAHWLRPPACPGGHLLICWKPGRRCCMIATDSCKTGRPSTGIEPRKAVINRDEVERPDLTNLPPEVVSYIESLENQLAAMTAGQYEEQAEATAEWNEPP